MAIRKKNIDYFKLDKLKEKPKNFSPHREKLHEIIFEAETKEGKLFDVVLLIMIVLSIIIVMWETVPHYYNNYRHIFLILEWIFTVFFTIEYFLRIYCVHKPRYYIFSFFGIVDLLSILPSYLALIFPGLHSLMIIRGLRLLRVFRIFKLDSFIEQGNMLIYALHESRKKLTVFAITISIIVAIFGSIMFLVEHNVNPQFNSIPMSIYFCIVTITTVGYGDIIPSTEFGKLLASILMFTGYIIIAVPTGIVTSSLMDNKNKYNTIVCDHCGKEGHDPMANFCDKCGEKM